MKASLTPRHRAFLKAYFENGENAAEAYKTAGFATAHPAQAASNLMRRPAIKAAIERMRAQAEKELGLSIEGCVKEFRALLTDAKNGGDIQSALRANENLAKIAGAYIEKHEDVTATQGNQADIAATLVAKVLNAILPLMAKHQVPADRVKSALLAEFGLTADKPQASALH